MHHWTQLVCVSSTIAYIFFAKVAVAGKIYDRRYRRFTLHFTTVKDLGRLIKQKRKEDGLTLEQAAAISGVSYAFLSALENGKETVRLNKVLQVTTSLGIELEAGPRGWRAGGGD
jgi:HTH-type transcriptional regulator / antitoxin HipB